MADQPVTPLDILRLHWNHDAFRNNQEEIIRQVLDKKDTLALLPTGGGKSICFQVPALLLPGLCLVITPLIALMKDQIQHLAKRKIKATAVFSGMSHREIEYQLDKCIYEDIKFLYVSPERLHTALFQGRLPDLKISFITVDEAHCISQWGYDFRPAYRFIKDFRQQLPQVPILALTATATPRVVEDIQTQLLFAKKNVIQSSFYRANLSYNFLHEENKLQRLVAIIQRLKGVGLVYVRSRARTAEIAAYLRSFQIYADHYHAGLPADERYGKQRRWQQSNQSVMVCTNAFGMGIDKPDVRFVIHLDIPEAPEAYFQEAGRAGRDGQKAFAILLYNQQDLTQLEQRKTYLPSLAELKKLYQALFAHYNIAYEAGELVTLPFDITALNGNLIWPVNKLLKGLKLLEQLQIIQLNEAFYRPSKLFIQATKKDLYTFQIENPKLDVLLKAILRLYGGVFESPVKIDEDKIAHQLHADKATVIKALQYMQQVGLLEYTPQQDKPTITFLEARQTEQLLQFDHEFLKKRIQQETEQIDGLAQLVTDQTTCRSIQLLAYFGETTTTPCGSCDVCRKQKITHGQLSEVLLQSIISHIQTKETTYEHLLKNFPSNQHQALQQAVEHLLSHEILERKPGNLLHLNHNFSL